MDGDHDHATPPIKQKNNTLYITTLPLAAPHLPSQQPPSKNATQWSSYIISDFSSNDQLLLLLQPSHDIDGDIQRLRYQRRRREGQPLSKRDVGDAVGLEDLDPHKLLSLGRVPACDGQRLRGSRPGRWVCLLDVMARVIWENGTVTRCEVECSSLLVAHEDCCASLALSEVHPFLDLGVRQYPQVVSLHLPAQKDDHSSLLTVGCQCNSRRPPGLIRTTDAAIVLEIGKLLESKI